MEKQQDMNRIINELCHFYKVSLIKTGLMFHKYHLLNEPIASFHEIQKITKMSFNIPLIDIKDKIHRERTFSIFNC